MESKPVANNPHILGQIVRLSIPLILCQFLNILAEQINYVFVGNLNDTSVLAAVGLGNATINVIANATIFGMNTALETRVA